MLGLNTRFQTQQKWILYSFFLRVHPKSWSRSKFHFLVIQREKEWFASTLLRHVGLMPYICTDRASVCELTSFLISEKNMAERSIPTGLLTVPCNDSEI